MFPSFLWRSIDTTLSQKFHPSLPQFPPFGACSSASVGVCPKHRISELSCFVEMHPAPKCKSSNHPNTRLGTLQGVASSWQAGNLEIEITKVTAKAAFGCIWHRSACLYIFVIELRSAACSFEKGYKHDEIRLGSAERIISSISTSLMVLF